VPRVVLMGPPGAGKGTQGYRLSRAWSVPHVASGDLLRRVVEGGVGPLAEAARVIHEGKMVSDEFASSIVFKELEGSPGFILDGYPRNLAQAGILDEYLRARGLVLDAVLALTLDEAEVLRRLGGRLTCANCGETYHALHQPPKAEGVCDRCGSALTVREDDRPESIRVRLALYAERTRPLLDFYRAAGVLREVDAVGTEEAVFARCVAAGVAAGAAAER
jgi:adenylate kinase